MKFVQTTEALFDLDEILQHPHMLKNDYFDRNVMTEEDWDEEEEEGDWQEDEDYEPFEELGMTLEELYEQSGLVYPTNLQEMATLLQKVELLVHHEWEGKMVWTPILTPYPKPEDLFRLPDSELRNLIRIRKERGVKV